MCTRMAKSGRWITIKTLLAVTINMHVGGARADDVQVNTYTTNSQTLAAVAMAADGDFVVVWASGGSPGTDSSSWSIQGQRYAADGSAIGNQFQVNTFTSDQQVFPSVAMDADGDFVVVWQSWGSGGSDSSNYSIQGQLYAADGSAVGGEFQVNTFVTNKQFHSSVAMSADGDFVVVWGSYGSLGTDTFGSSIQGQRYAADGSAVDGQFQVNTDTMWTQRYPSVAAALNGDFVVVWENTGSSSVFGISGQRYASDGATLGGEFQVNTYPTGSHNGPSVAVDGAGGFVAVWYSDYSDGTDSSGFSVQGQRYAPDGSPVGAEFQVNTYTTGWQLFPSVAAGADGNFIVVWHGESAMDTSFNGIQGQRYAADGSPVGGELQINTYTTSYQTLPSVALRTDDDFVVVWGSDGSTGTDTDSRSVQKTAARLIFADGFESGDTSGWN